MFTAMDLKKWSNENKIKNIVFFNSDTLRWDQRPKEVTKMGVTIKTVTSSLFTGCSFPSMMTGLHPLNHRVFSFFNKIPKNTKSLLNLKNYNCSLWTASKLKSKNGKKFKQLYRILRHNKATSLTKIKPPFIYIENEKGGHCPYGWD